MVIYRCRCPSQRTPSLRAELPPSIDRSILSFLQFVRLTQNQYRSIVTTLLSTSCARIPILAAELNLTFRYSWVRNRYVVHSKCIHTPIPSHPAVAVVVAPASASLVPADWTVSMRTGSDVRQQKQQRLIVRNLNFHAKEEDLAEAFSEFGPLKEVIDALCAKASLTIPNSTPQHNKHEVADWFRWMPVTSTAPPPGNATKSKSKSRSKSILQREFEFVCVQYLFNEGSSFADRQDSLCLSLDFILEPVCELCRRVAESS